MPKKYCKKMSYGYKAVTSSQFESCKKITTKSYNKKILKLRIMARK